MRNSEQQLSWSSDSRSSHTPQTRLPPSQLNSETRVPAASTQPDVSDAAATRAPLHLQHARKQHLCDHNSRDNRVRESHQATTSLQAAVRSEPLPAPLDPPPRARVHSMQSDADAHRRTRMIDPPNVPESACATPSAAQNPVATHQQTQPTYAEPCSSVMSPQPARRTTSGRTVTSSNRYELKPGKIVTPSPAHPLGAVKPLDVPSASYELNPWDVPETGST